jgi:putative ABC transport system ATP-binding protein
MRRIFEVSKTLECSYPKRGKVLEVPNLEIYPGEIVVILGNSGSGKSTLIETLGLMTNTLGTDNDNEGKGEIMFYPTNDKKDAVSIPGIWTEGNNGEGVTRIRRNNFNFIFQDNNLMSNLRNDENIILADLINEGLTFDESKKNTSETCEKLNINKKVEESLPMNVSGGERQRVAFARGIQPEFKVLFGDEPTGNLDEENSETLMQYLRLKIPQDSSDKAAIIVSHNIDLSLRFADRIIILTNATNNEKDYDESNEENQESYYEILPEYTFTRKSRKSDLWQGKFPLKNESGAKGFPKLNSTNLVAKKVPLHKLEKYDFEDVPALSENRIDSEEHEGHVNLKSLKNYIQYILQKNLENNKAKNVREESHLTWAVKAMTWIGVTLMGFAKWIALTFNMKEYLSKLSINEYFSKLLFEKECEQLAGKKNSSIKFLSISIFMTFLIIGLANGQLDELKNELMNDPFTLTLDVLHRGGQMQKDTKELLNEILSNKDTMEFYKIDQISEFDRNYLTLYDFKNPAKDQFFLGRSMKYNDPLVEKILDEAINPLSNGRGFDSNKDIGLIVTKDLMKDLNYDFDSPVIYCKMFDDNSGEYLEVPLPVIAFVDQLPGRRKNYFLYTPCFYDYFKDKDDGFPYQAEKNIKVAARINQDQIKDFEATLEQALNELKQPEIPYIKDYKKIKIDSTATKHFRDKIYEFVIYPKKNNRNLHEQELLIDTLFNTSTFRQYFTENDLTPGKDVFQLFYFDVPMEADKSLQDDDKERGNISFLFKDPTRIKEFSTMFTARTTAIDDKKEGLLLDIGKVTSMFIFSKISILTYSILIILIIIIVYSNMQYISNLLNLHLYKIRRNIGTLMAFGINIKTIYHFLLLSFVLYCFLVSFVLANIFGYFILDYFDILTFSLYSGFNRLDVYMTLAATILIFGGSYLVYFFAKYNYFSKTPSQLIYNRMDNDFWKQLRRRVFGGKKKEEKQK